MTNDDTILREVDQALAEDTASQSIRKHLPAIVAAGLIVVGGVGGWQFWTAQRTAAATKASAAYDEALRNAGGEEATKTLETLADGRGGYAALAKMRLAGDHAAKGENDKALALYRDVYAGGGGSKRLKDMARLKAAYLSLGDSREAALTDVGALETDETAIGFFAREILALAAFKAGDYQRAEEMFLKAAASPDAPEGVRLRAAEFAALASAGKAGVEIPVIKESETSGVDQFIKALEEAGSDLSSVVAGDGAEPPADAPPEAASDPAAPEGNE